MSKKLNIIEAMKMPIGTEFKIIIYGKDDGMVFLKKFDREDKGNCLYWKEDRETSESQVYITDETINATFIPIQQPVSFMEAINSGKRIKCVHYRLTRRNIYMSISEMFGRMSESIHEDFIPILINEGKWYIEESEGGSDE